VVDGVALLLHLVGADEQLQIVLLQKGLRVVRPEAEPHASLGRRAPLLRVGVCGEISSEGGNCGSAGNFINTDDYL